VIVQGLLEQLPVAPLDAVAVYPSMVAPPLELGAVKATVAVVFPADTEVIVGLVGVTAAIVKVTACVPAEYAVVAAAVAVTTHVPVDEYVKVPVSESTAHEPLVTEYVIAPSPSVVAVAEGVTGESVNSSEVLFGLHVTVWVAF